MNTEITRSCTNNDPSVSDMPMVMSQGNYEDENSVIIWYQNQNESSDSIFQFNVNNNEDFIEIDMFPDWSEQDESNEELEGISPLDNTADDAHIVDTLFPDEISNITELSSGTEISQTQFVSNFSKMLNETEDDGHVINNDTKEKNVSVCQLPDSKLKYSINFSNSVNISCYVDGLVAVLQSYKRIDSFIEKFAQITNNCKCTPSVVRQGNISLSQYLLEASGASCENCSMDFIVEKLNTVFLRNVARVEFVTVSEMVKSFHFGLNNPIGATSSSCRYSSGISNNLYLETGWLRKWLLKHLTDGVVAAVVYNDLIGDNFNCRPCNRVNLRRVVDVTEREITLMTPLESVSDEVIENHFLKDETINVPKSNILKCQLQNEDFEVILSQTDERFNEMNVLGQIIGTFREKSSDSFKGFVPDEIHHIKIPNMHRNGVMLIVNV